MSTTRRYDVPVYGRVSVTCNEDWSGSAQVTWGLQEVSSVWIPAGLFREVAAALVKGRLSDKLLYPYVRDLLEDLR